MDEDVKTVVYVGLAAGLAYFLWKTFGAVNQSLNTAAQGVANTYVDWTSGPTVSSQITGQVLYPDGTVMFPASQLPSVSPHWVGTTLQFSYGGLTYQLSPSDANGNNTATPLNGLGNYSRRRYARR